MAVQVQSMGACLGVPLKALAPLCHAQQAAGWLRPCPIHGPRALLAFPATRRNPQVFVERARSALQPAPPPTPAQQRAPAAMQLSLAPTAASQALGHRLGALDVIGLDLEVNHPGHVLPPVLASSQHGSRHHGAEGVGWSPRAIPDDAIAT